MLWAERRSRAMSAPQSATSTAAGCAGDVAAGPVTRACLSVGQPPGDHARNDAAKEDQQLAAMRGFECMRDPAAQRQHALGQRRRQAEADERFGPDQSRSRSEDGAAL